MKAIRHKRGDAFKRTGVFRHKSNKEPVNLTGMTMKCIAKREMNHEQILFDLSTEEGEGITYVDVENGKFTIKVSDTSDWELGRYVFDIQITDALGDPKSSSNAFIDVVKDIS